MKKALNEYKALPAKEKALGKGLASTGNAGKLTSAEPDPTESYPLKLLVETGALGLLVIGGVLVWALIRFGRTALGGRRPDERASGRPGIGLSAESLIYPTLEVQLLSLTWWLILVICLEAPRTPLWDRLIAARVARADAKSSGAPTRLRHASPAAEFAAKPPLYPSAFDGRSNEQVSRPRIIVAVALVGGARGGARVLAACAERRLERRAPPPPTRASFFGIVQGIRLDSQDFQTMAEAGRRLGPLPADLGRRAADQGRPVQLGPTDALIGAFASHGIRPCPICGEPRPGWPGRSVAPAARPARGPEGVAGVPEGGGGALRARRHLLGRRTTSSSYGADADAAPGPVVADLERAQPDEVLRPQALARPVRPAPRDLPRRDQEPGPERPDRPRRNARLRRRRTPGTSSTASTRCRDPRTTSTPPLFIPTPPDVEQLAARDREGPRGDDEHGDQATPLWITEIGWGSAPPDKFGINQGLPGPGRMLEKLLQADPAATRRTWNMRRLFWFDWRDPSPSGVVKPAASAPAPGCFATTARRSPPTTLSAFYTSAD